MTPLEYALVAITGVSTGLVTIVVFALPGAMNRRVRTVHARIRELEGRVQELEDGDDA